MDERLKKAIVKLKKTQLELNTLKKQTKESIAIIGMSCRFPKGANDPERFWQLLSEGYDGIVEIPKERWNIEDFYDPDPATPGKMYVRRSGFLNGSIDTFDARFFGISTREANYMDPQQRLLLEVAWEALENACIDPLSLNGSLSGVFIGISNVDYSALINRLGSIESINAYIATGNSYSATAGRLSYFLGLQGPCLAIDTACSSSLVALNYACKSLQSGECNLALSGGVHLMFNPGTTILECKSQMLSKDGYCKTFDAEADGFARGEGCGVIVLKRLSDAIQDEDPILGIIRATSVNQDGATAGFTVPNGESQTALIRTVLAQAELDPNAVDYIEAHGTGTPLGDPIEIRALSSIFRGRKDQPLWIGSVKTNIGHLEAAAGVAGVIKTVLSLNHQAIPPHLHFKQLNPHIPLDSIPAKIPLTLTPWPRSNRPRIAGVSSFGFSGTNAHAIIEEPPIITPSINVIDRPLHLLTLSAKTPAALDQLISLYIKQIPNEDLANIAFTANAGRAHFSHRATVIAQNREELLHHLETGEYLIGQAPASPPELIFFFTGKKPENQELLTAYPVFNEALERSKGLYEYALLELWKSWGIAPNYVAGEGEGDVIAAIAAGIITLDEGLKLLASKEAASEISYCKPQIGFISSRTGEVIRQEGITDDYWQPHKNVRNFPQGAIVISNQNNWKELLQTLAQLYLNGIRVDWKGFEKPYHRKKVSLPTYPFQRERYWVEEFLTTQLEIKVASWFYQLVWQPKLLDRNTEFRIQNSEFWLSVSQKENTFEGLQSKTVKPEEAIAEMIRNKPTDVLWDVSGKESLKQILSFIQALSKIQKKPRLTFITHGIQPIDSIIDLENAAFNGFYKTLKLELPDLECRHIDLNPNEMFPRDELLAIEQEDQIAYRAGIRYVPRLSHAQELKHNENKIKIDPDGSYLITGGLGGLGKKVAEWLAKQGAKHLVLVGRNPSQKIEIPEVTVETATVDISQKPDVIALMQKFGNQWPELKGIIHAAGIIDDAILANQEWSRFEKVFAPKIQGSWNLHEASLTKPLDFFVLFSSLASSIGAPGQINYASANSYMDALAYFRHQQGLPALAISWGPWAEVGLAAKLTERHRASGLIAFKPNEGIKAFELALTLNVPHMSIANIDWKLLPTLPSFFSELIPSKPAGTPILLQRLSSALPSERKNLLIDYLQQTVCKILGTTSLTPELGFFEAGMDSLMAVELYNKLQADIGNLYKLSPTLVIENSSIQKLGHFLEETLFPLLESHKEIQTVTSKSSLIIPFRTEGSHYPLFLIHGADGHTFGFVELTKALGDSYPLYGIQPQGFNLDEPFHTSLVEAVNHYIEVICSIQIEGPYHLGGVSAGGVVATEIAFQLEKQGESVNLLTCFDTVDPIGNKKVFSKLNSLVLYLAFIDRHFGTDISSLFGDYSQLDPQKALKLIYENVIQKDEKFRDYTLADLKHTWDLSLNISSWINAYTPKHFAKLKQACLFISKHGLFESLGLPIPTVPFKIDNDNAVDEYTLDCDHFAIIDPPHINVIADILKNHIPRAAPNSKFEQCESSRG